MLIIFTFIQYKKACWVNEDLDCYNNNNSICNYYRIEKAG